MHDEVSSWMLWKKRRYVIGFCIFFGTTAAYATRVNLSVAIVKMTSNLTTISENGTVINQSPEFDWDSKTVGLVLGSFFYGYISTQMLGGWLAGRFGGKHVFGIGIGFAAFLSIITPPAVRVSVYFLVALRILEGVFEGLTFPAINAIWANWAPPLERTKLSAFTVCGSSFATVLAMPICSVMAERLGWPSLFYALGAFGLIWYVTWCVIVKDRPEDDPYISESELKYIKEALSTVERGKISYPWKAMLKSPVLWSVMAAHSSENWGYVTMITYLPTYMNDVLHFQIEEAGYLSGLPYLFMFLSLMVSGVVADYIRSRKILTTTQVRKICVCGAFVSQAVFMILAIYVTSPTVAVICIVMGVGIGGMAWSGFGPNYLDISPHHASITFGLGNAIGTIPGILSPLVTGYVVQNKTVEEWRIVFLISSGIYLFGAVIFGLFSSGEEQPWAKDNKQKIDNVQTDASHASKSSPTD